MIHSRDLVSRMVVCLLAGIALAACSEPTATELPESSPEFSAIGPTALVCPTAEASTAEAVIGPRGGIVAVGRNSVIVPPDAVSEERRITITIPASDRLEVDLRADDLESFRFQRPVLVTLSYAHCGDGSAAERSAWYVDSTSRRFLDRMPSIDNPWTETVTFITDHFSVYMVAD